MSLRPILTKSAAPAKKVGSSTSKKTTQPKPVDKTARTHPMLTDESPLTRQVCAAANLPDVQALLLALAHPMTDEDQAALAKRAGGHPAHATRIKHLRELALKQHGDSTQAEETTKSFAKSSGAVAHHKLISLGHEGPGSRGGHPWWNEHRNHEQGDWDYGPRPKGHQDIHEPLHPLHDEHRTRIKDIEEAAYQLGCEVNLPLFAWDRPKRSKKERDYIAFTKPVEEPHLQRLRDAWTAATAEHHAGGRDWYPQVHVMCKEWSDDTHAPGYEGRPLSADEIAMIIAVASPRMPWESNLNIAYHAIFGATLAEIGSDGQKLQVNHVEQVMNKIDLVKRGAYPTLTAMLCTEKGEPRDLPHDELMIQSPKTYSFWRNMTDRDNADATTADRHMFAIMGFNIDDRGDETYEYAVRAMRQVAAEKGIEPRVLQAVTWVWYEDHIGAHVHQTMRQATKDRVADNDVYGTYLRDARGHKPTDKDPKTKERVALQHRKLAEETAKLARAEERAAASARTGSATQATHRAAMEAARAAVTTRQAVIDRHNLMIDAALQQAGVEKSFRTFRRSHCQTTR